MDKMILTPNEWHEWLVSHDSLTQMDIIIMCMEVARKGYTAVVAANLVKLAVDAAFDVSLIPSKRVH